MVGWWSAVNNKIVRNPDNLQEQLVLCKQMRAHLRLDGAVKVTLVYKEEDADVLLRCWEKDLQFALDEGMEEAMRMTFDDFCAVHLLLGAVSSAKIVVKGIVEDTVGDQKPERN
jgi:hypothetical protein